MKIEHKVMLSLVLSPIIVGLFIFGPAGTLDYWEGWLFIVTLFVPVYFVALYFLKNDREFLERRMKTKEKIPEQGMIVMVSMLVFFVGFMIPGLDHRFGWSEIPPLLVVFADILVLAGYCFVFLSFRENSYAGRTIEVVEGQKVISSGPYAVVRHPMYLGTLLLYLSIPIALGSLVAMPVFLLLVPLIGMRIINEEKILEKELPGYGEYCKKTRYRLVPHVW